MKKAIFLTCFIWVISSSICFAGGKSIHGSYFDSLTGHKYIKLDQSTYAEFSKRGAFLKKVPSNLPLLKKSANIHPITEGSYILYTKSSYGLPDQKILPGTTIHPKGWKADKILVPLNQKELMLRMVIVAVCILTKARPTGTILSIIFVNFIPDIS